MSWVSLAALFGFQGAAMAIDEFHFHRARGLPRWERIGHPLDTATVILCYSILLAFPCTPRMLGIYLGLAIFSSLWITKDEFVHAKLCTGGEHWLHALLFVAHPLLLGLPAYFWPVLHDLESPGSEPIRWLIYGQTGLMILFGVYQVVFWNLVEGDRPPTVSRKFPSRPALHRHRIQF